MLNLTRYEKAIITFLALSALLGSGILYYQKVCARIELEVSPLDPEGARIQGVRLVNINEATLQELIRLPGIGPVLARRIIDYRNLHGPFQKIEAIKNVKGIGREKFEQVRELLVIE